MTPRYNIVLRGDLILLWYNAYRLIAICNPQREGVDTVFYEAQGWKIIESSRYRGPEDKKNIITMSGKEAINEALKAAEMTHRLSI